MRLEKKGKPTVTMTTPGFYSEISGHAKMAGLPYLPIIPTDYVTEHAVLVAKATEKILDKVVAGLTTPAKELQKKAEGAL